MPELLGYTWTPNNKYAGDPTGFWTPDTPDPQKVAEKVADDNFAYYNAIANLTNTSNGEAGRTMSDEYAAKILTGEVENPRKLYDQLTNGGSPQILNTQGQQVYSDFVKANYLPAQLDPSDSSTGISPQLTNAQYKTREAQTGTGGNSPTGFVGTTAPSLFEKIGTAGIIGAIALIVVVLLIVSGLRGTSRAYGSGH